MRVQSLDHTDVTVGPIEALSTPLEVRGRHGFEPHEQPAAPAASAEVEQLRIVGEENRGETVPVHPERHKRDEERLRVFPVGDDVEVHEDELAGTVPADLLHDLLDRLPIQRAPPRCRHHAELARVHAPSRRLEDVLRQEAATRQKVNAVRRAARRGSGRPPWCTAAGASPRPCRAAPVATCLPHSPSRWRRRGVAHPPG